MISQMFEKKLRGDVFKLSVVTVITVIVWIAAVTFSSLKKSQVKPDVKKQLLPLTTSIDLDTMEKIKAKQILPEINWASIGPVNADIFLLPQETATEAAEITPTASESGQTE